MIRSDAEQHTVAAAGIAAGAYAAKEVTASRPLVALHYKVSRSHGQVTRSIERTVQRLPNGDHVETVEGGSRITIPGGGYEWKKNSGGAKHFLLDKSGKRRMELTREQFYRLTPD